MSDPTRIWIYLEDFWALVVDIWNRGVFGVAVALGAQDLFKNLIAGISILAERRFQPGDWIMVEGAGSAFAFPNRSIHVETPSGETPEPVVPPEPEGRKPDDGEKEFIMAERTS